MIKCYSILGSIPGFPTTLTLKYVQQEMSTIKDTTVLDYICRDLTDLAGGSMSVEKLEQRIARLRHKETGLEAALDEVDVSNEEQISEMADQLCALAEEIEQLEKQKNELVTSNKNAPAAATVESKKTTVSNVKEVYAALVSSWCKRLLICY